jgi:uncharacterized protein YraI
VLVTPAGAYFATSDQQLHAGPGDQTPVAGSVGQGQHISLIKCKAAWCLVSTGQKKGWLELRFVGTAAVGSNPWPPPQPTVDMPPTWRYRNGPLDFADPPLGRPRDPLADPKLNHP